MNISILFGNITVYTLSADKNGYNHYCRGEKEKTERNNKTWHSTGFLYVLTHRALTVYPNFVDMKEHKDKNGHNHFSRPSVSR